MRTNASDITAMPNPLRLPLTRWDQILGNRKLKRTLQGLVRRIRSEMRQTGTVSDAGRLCLLLTGPSRSGKTATVNLCLRSLTCQKLDEETLDPCDGTCPTCRQRPEIFGLEGLYALAEAQDSRTQVNVSVVDCTKIDSPSQLRERLTEIGYLRDGLQVCCFDEVHRLVSRGMDEMLLKEVEEKNFLWIFSTAKPEQLEDMFLNRLIKLETEPPTPAEMEKWLCDRCDEWGINWEPQAIVRLVEKSNRIVGTALHALALASLHPEEGLTLDRVENDWKAKLEG